MSPSSLQYYRRVVPDFGPCTESIQKSYKGGNFRKCVFFTRENISVTLQSKYDRITAPIVQPIFRAIFFKLTFIGHNEQINTTSLQLSMCKLLKFYKGFEDKNGRGSTVGMEE